MKAVVFDKTLVLVDVPVPVCKAGEVLIRVAKAGICNTDHEILQGYIPGFKGILGHEFIGTVRDAFDTSLVGKRVTAEINCGCNACDYCRRGMQRHCPDRTVIGIDSRDGAFAEYIAVPAENVVEIPADIPDDDAIFIEPLSAALEICEQISIENKSVLVLGDGKLGLLIAHVLSRKQCDLLVAGKHREKLDLLKPLGVPTVLVSGLEKKRFDVVIEASGNPSGFSLSMECVRPRGVIVLKSTYAQAFMFNPGPLVVNEVTCVGSRCGRFPEALRFIKAYKPDFSSLISAQFDLRDALAAFEYSKRPNVLKVVITME